MPICTQCGERNPDNASRCEKCGVTLGSQQRSRQDAVNSRNNLVVRSTLWVAAIVVAAVVAPSAFHTGKAKYLEFRLRSVTSKVNYGCDGPVTDSTPAYKKDEINKCIAASTDLSDAQAAYDSFTKGDKK